MSLKELLHKGSNANGSTPSPAPAATAVPSLTLVRQKREVREAPEAAAFRELKNQIHEYLLQTIDVAKLEMLEAAQVNSRLSTLINERLDQEGRLVSERDRARLI